MMSPEAHAPSGFLDPALRADGEYWLAQLADLPAAAAIPVDYERSSDPAPRDLTAVVTLGAGVRQRLDVVSRGKPALALTVHVAAITALLRRYGAGDVVVGTAIQARDRDLAHLNQALLLRTRIEPAWSGRDLVTHVQQTLRDAYAHQRFPYTLLCARLRQRQADAGPRDAGAAVETPCRVFALVDTINEPAHVAPLDHDLTWTLRLSAAGAASVEIHYAGRLFHPATIARLGAQYRRLLVDLLDAPDAALATYGEPDEAGMRAAVERFNDTREAYPADVTVSQLVEQAAAAHGHAPAVVDGATAITYDTLNRRANRWAWRLRDAGIGPGQRVGLYVRHSIDMVVGVLAILKAGAAYVPFDPDDGEVRVRDCCARAGLSAMLTQRDLAASVPDPTRPLWLLDAETEPPSRDGNLPPLARPGDLAYVLFTSGSTGVPKGVMIEHRALLNYSWWAARVYFERQPLGIALYSSLGFDLTVTSIVPPLLTGGRILVHPPVHGRPPFEAMLDDPGVELIKLTPSHLRLIKDRDNRRSRVRRLIVGGESLERDLARETRESFGRPVEILNEYGPTEATVGCMRHAFDPDDRRPAVPIGRPAANVQIFVLDAAGRPVDEGLEGELHIAGDGLARGYVGDAGLTAARFVPNPFAPGQRMYATGDVVRRLSTGDLEYLGRRDDQVKYHGVRLELNEVRAALNQHPHARDSVALIRRDAAGDPHLVVYYAARRAIDVADLRAFMAARLPAGSRPNRYVHLKRLPLTLNGKVDRQALPSLEQLTTREALASEGSAAPEGSATDDAAPRTPTENRLSEVWCDVLGLPRVGLHDNFFELGGDSILSLRLVAKAVRAGLPLTPADIFEHQTIATLARRIAALGGTPAAPASPVPAPAVTPDTTPDTMSAAARGADADAVPGFAPLTPIQRWFVEQPLRAPQRVTQSALLAWRDRVPLASMERAWQALVRAHPSLRLVVRREGDEWRQSCAAWRGARLVHIVDLSPLREHDRRRARRRATVDAQASLDLACPPLVRVLWITAGESRDPHLFVTVHHLAMDNVSWPILFDDLQEGLRLAQRGDDRAALGGDDRGEIVLAPEACSYEAWASWLATEARAASTLDERPYWTRLVHDAPGRLPTARGDVAEAAVATTRLSEAQTTALLRHATAPIGARVHEVLLAVLGQVLSRWADGQPLLVDVERHGRDFAPPDLDLSRTIGWFTSIAPVRAEAGPDDDPLGWVRTMQRQLRAVPRAGIGYGLLRHAGPPAVREDLSAHRASVSFNYQGRVDKVFADAAPFGWADEEIGPSRPPEEPRPYLLEVDARVSHGCLCVDWLYDRSTWQTDAVDRAAADLQQRLQALLDACESHREADIYGLSPLQQAMLTHATAPGGAYVIQFRCDLEPPFDVAAFREAWRRIVERHAILRTRFAWMDRPEPVQIVEPDVELRWEEEDWRGLPPHEQAARRDALIADDRRRGCRPEQAPLLRLALQRLDEGRYGFLGSSHHLLLDGWSTQLLLRDVLTAYRACVARAAPDAPAAPAYRDYIAWLSSQDPAKAEAYWRAYLAGFREPTPVPADVAIPCSPPRRTTRILSEEDTATLARAGRRHRVTPSTIAQVAWALLLGHAAGTDDVVFGVTVAGRPADLPGMERMLGPFINTLPMRVRIDLASPLDDWLRAVQARRLAMGPFEHSALRQLHAWSEVPAGRALFDSVLVFENYPVDRTLAAEARALGVSGFDTLSTGDSLSIVVTPGRALALELWDDRPDRATDGPALLDALHDLLVRIGRDEAQTVGDVVRVLDERVAQAQAASLHRFRAHRRERLGALAGGARSSVDAS